MAKSPTNPALRLAAIRRWHSWIGVFTAPSLIFFAFTGIVQIFSLHEARGGYHPPALIEGLSAVHKDQIFRVRSAEPAANPGGGRDRAGAPAGQGPKSRGPGKREGQPVKVYVLKWLFTFVGLGLMTSTALGLWMSLAYGRDKRLLWGLLAAGAVLPILLVLI